MCFKALSNLSPFYCRSPGASLSGCTLLTFIPMGTSPCPQYPSSFSHTPKPLFMPYPLLEWPFPALYSAGNLLPFFMTRLKCSFFRVAFPTCPHSLGQQIFVVGPRSQVLMIQKPTVRATLRGTMRGHLETRKRYQGSRVDVLNVARGG